MASKLDMKAIAKIFNNQKHEGRLPTATTNDSPCSPASETHNCITLKVSPPKPPRLSQSQENLTRTPMQTMAESRVEVAIYQTPSTVVIGSEGHATVQDEEGTAQPYGIIDTSAFQKPDKTVTVSISVSLIENFKQCFTRISVSHRFHSLTLCYSLSTILNLTIY